MSSDTTGVVMVDPLGGLQLDPSNELRFKGPFDDYVAVSLTIKNPTEKRIAFKIKTTAPKRYCVKPNSGVLDSSQSMKVNGNKVTINFQIELLYLEQQKINKNYIIFISVSFFYHSSIVTTI